MKRFSKSVEITPEYLAQMRWWYRPGGSGPNRVCAVVVRLVEQIAEDQNIDLDEVEWTVQSVNGHGERGAMDGAKFRGLKEVEE